MVIGLGIDVIGVEVDAEVVEVKIGTIAADLNKTQTSTDGTKVIQIHNLEGFVVVVEAGVEVVVS